jgi:hypothetical protein
VNAAGRLAAVLVLLGPALRGFGAVAAETPVPVGRTRSATAEGASVPLGGTLVSALAAGADGALWLLVRPVEALDGPRRLLRIAGWPEPVATVAAEDLGGWIKTLAAIDLGAGPELVAGGLGRLDSLGPLAAPGGAARTLLEHPGFDLRSLAPQSLRIGIDSRLAAAEVGRLRVWAPAAGGLRLVSERPLPFAVERTASGLRMASPRAAAVAGPKGSPRWVVGPLPVGRSRLRTLRFDGDSDAAAEAWSALPAPEGVTASWAVALDGVPVLVVRTQGSETLDLFERQRLRVLPLSTDRTRAGVPPELAVELDAKRWQPTEIAAGDVDGDGLDDLAAVFPEGLSGGDLVVQIWRGADGGRLERKARRSDLDDAPEQWLLVAGATAEGGPALLMVWPDRVELRALGGGRRAVEPSPRFALPIAAPGGARSEVTVSVGGTDGATVERRTEVEALGVAELDGRPGAEALILTPAADGSDLLVVVRRRDGGG